MTRGIVFLQRLSDRLVQGEKIIIFISGIFICMAMFLQVLLRYVFSAPLFGIEEVSVLVVSWFYFIGCAYSVYTESDIKVDILFLLVKNKQIRRKCRIFSLCVSFVTAGVFFYFTLRYAIWMGMSHVTTPVFLISQNYGFSAIVVGSALMMFHLFCLILKEFTQKKIQ